MKNFSVKEKEFMYQALLEAKKAYKKGEVPVGAVIVKNNRIISKGHNINLTTKDPSAHAEIVAIRRAAKKIKNYRLTECEMYVTLEPCPMCAGAIVYSRIKKLIYSIEDPKSGACKSIFNIVNNKMLNHRVEFESGLCKKEAKQLIQKFFINKR
jgi:tRNA(adenine34) deaminase